MNQEKRPSPKDKPISLFVTCMVDMLYPQTAVSVVRVLEHLGLTVTFPSGQTCCGQPAYNAGYRPEARQVARQFLRAFAEAEVIVTPSGSCAAMVRHEYPRLFADDPKLLPEAERLAAITWEFSEYLLDGLGITDVNGRLPEPTSFAFHDACHGLHLLGLGKAGRTLVGNLQNGAVTKLPDSELCCGFGGLFSVKMADVSGAMLAQKLAHIQACPAQVLTGDVSCLTHINGGLAKVGSKQRVKHFADVLAEGIG